MTCHRIGCEHERELASPATLGGLWAWRPPPAQRRRSPPADRRRTPSAQRRRPPKLAPSLLVRRVVFEPPPPKANARVEQHCVQRPVHDIAVLPDLETPWCYLAHEIKRIRHLERGNDGLLRLSPVWPRIRLSAFALVLPTTRHVGLRTYTTCEGRPGLVLGRGPGTPFKVKLFVLGPANPVTSMQGEARAHATCAGEAGAVCVCVFVCVCACAFAHEHAHLTQKKYTRTCTRTCAHDIRHQTSDTP